MSGLRVLITGASSGIGNATCRIFARQGATVFATGRNETALAALREAGGCAHLLAGDVTDASFVTTLVADAVAKMGSLTTVINCAGILIGGAVGTPEGSLATWDANFATNSRGVFAMIDATVPHLKVAARDGAPAAIVNVSSVTGVQSFAGVAAYCASKAAVDMLTRCAAVDLAPHGIRVNAVNPGVVITELQRRGGMSDDRYSAFLDRSMETHPLSRAPNRPPESEAPKGLATPDEVGEVIWFLASSKASFVTGVSIPIDGGRIASGLR